MSQKSKKAVFVSFDFDNDRVLKDFIVGQSRLDDSPFEVIDHSLKEAAPESDILYVNLAKIFAQGGDREKHRRAPHTRVFRGLLLRRCHAADLVSESLHKATANFIVSNG